MALSDEEIDRIARQRNSQLRDEEIDRIARQRLAEGRAEPPSPLQSAVTGAVDTASFGLADEIEGGVKAAKDWVTGEVPRTSEGFSTAYEGHKAQDQLDSAVSEAANPKSHTAGQVAGFVGGSLIPVPGARAVLGAKAAKGLATAGKAGKSLATKAGGLVGIQPQGIARLTSGGSSLARPTAEGALHAYGTDEDVGTGAALAAGTTAGLRKAQQVGGALFKSLVNKPAQTAALKRGTTLAKDPTVGRKEFFNRVEEPSERLYKQIMDEIKLHDPRAKVLSQNLDEVQDAINAIEFAPELGEKLGEKQLAALPGLLKQRDQIMKRINDIASERGIATPRIKELRKQLKTEDSKLYKMGYTKPKHSVGKPVRPEIGQIRDAYTRHNMAGENRMFDKLIMQTTDSDDIRRGVISLAAKGVTSAVQDVGDFTSQNSRKAVSSLLGRIRDRVSPMTKTMMSTMDDGQRQELLKRINKLREAKEQEEYLNKQK